MQQDRVSRITLPTASYSLRQPHIDWIKAESAKREISASEFLRTLIDAAMAAAGAGTRAEKARAA